MGAYIHGVLIFYGCLLSMVVVSGEWSGVLVIVNYISGALRYNVCVVDKIIGVDPQKLVVAKFSTSFCYCKINLQVVTICFLQWMVFDFRNEQSSPTFESIAC